MNIWIKVLEQLKLQLTKPTFEMFFKQTAYIEETDQHLLISVPSEFVKDWLQTKYSSLILSSVVSITGKEIEVVYRIDEKPLKDEISSKKKSENTHTKKDLLQNCPLNERYTFENFIVGNGHHFAHAACKSISEFPGSTYNPLFLYGGVGLGKTHLIQAAGNKILETAPDKKVIYLPSDTFTVDFVEAIQSNKINEFSNFYRGMDVLIIDDIQFLIGKEKTQDLFFHIFNTLHQSGKQIILSSDKPPKELKGLDERLTSRFQWVLSADIQPPELDTRIAILKRKASDYGMNISSEIIEYIASNITNNIRELEGCLIKLLANASLNSVEIDFELAKKIVKEIATDRKVNVTVENITKIVCSYLNIAENKIRDKTRKKEIVLARQLAMYFSKELTKSSLKSIGLQFGGRDHSTVIHACNSIEESIVSDPSMKDLVKAIKTQIELVSS